MLELEALQTGVADIVYRHTGCSNDSAEAAAQELVRVLRNAAEGVDEETAAPAPRAPQPVLTAGPSLPRVCPTCAGTGRVVPYA